MALQPPGVKKAQRCAGLHDHLHDDVVVVVAVAAAVEVASLLVAVMIAIVVVIGGGGGLLEGLLVSELKSCSSPGVRRPTTCQLQVNRSGSLSQAGGCSDADGILKYHWKCTVMCCTSLL
jgi:hypothetical protein